MTYVPIVTPVPTEQPPSRQTQELADLLGRVVQEYEKAHPTITGPEVSQALQLAKRASAKAGGGQQAMVIAMVLGISVMVAGIVFFLAAQGGGGFTVKDGTLIVGIIGLAIAGAFVAILKRNE